MSASSANPQYNRSLPEKRMQLTYSQIYTILYEGLVPYINCFLRKRDHVLSFEKVKKEFTDNFGKVVTFTEQRSPQKEFEMFSHLMFIKAGYPNLYTLTTQEREQLHKLGIMPNLDHSAEKLVSDFFGRQIVEDFIKINTTNTVKTVKFLDNFGIEQKEQHNIQDTLLALVAVVYSTITTAIHSVDDENYLNKCVKEDKLQNFTAFDVVFNGAIAQSSRCNLVLHKLKETTSQGDTLTTTFANISSRIGMAYNEYNKNKNAVEAQKKLAEEQAAREAANLARMVLQNELRSLNQKVQQLELEKQLEEQRRKEEAEKAKLDATPTSDSSASSGLFSARSRSTSPSSASSSGGTEADSLRRENEVLRRQNNQYLMNARIRALQKNPKKRQWIKNH